VETGKGSGGRGIRSLWERVTRNSISNIIFLTFTLTGLIAMLLTGLTLYSRFSEQLNDSARQQNDSLIRQANQSLGGIFQNVSNLADAIDDDVIHGRDAADAGFEPDLRLFLAANPQDLAGISLYANDGSLLSEAPATFRPLRASRSQAWFESALANPGNMQYGAPHPRLTGDGRNGELSYVWTVPASVSVEITRGATTERGVLLIEIRYSAISDILNKVTLPSGGYLYLTDAEGTILCHPRMQLIASGDLIENNVYESQLGGEPFTYEYEGARRSVTVESVTFTGWKLIAVIPDSGMRLTSQNTLFIILIFLFCFLALIVVNNFTAERVTGPLHDLEESVVQLERSDWNSLIYHGGTWEIRHLSVSIQNMVDQIRKMSDDMVRQSESRRRSELTALQSQINPHFLYNTLDIIIWMIENEKKDGAVQVVSALARFFRISLSGGRNIIPVSQEIEHIASYLTIQEKRYKEKFTWRATCTNDAKDLGVIKLVIQPLVENAIYHSMEYMDGDGEIDINAFVDGQGLLRITVEDNGMGMPPEVVEGLLDRERPNTPSRRGSGIGLKNVNERIKLQFGAQYGLSVESEPDEGTKITITAPAIPYSELEEKEYGTP